MKFGGAQNEKNCGLHYTALQKGIFYRPNRDRIYCSEEEPQEHVTCDRDIYGPYP